MDETLKLGLYVLPMVAIWAGYVAVGARRHQRAASAREAALREGLAEPMSLHPVIDPGRCLGCGSCAVACPEGDVLGILAGRAELINPSHCIGHGACAEACPTDAITLVFGTEKRGVDIPVVSPHFETNVPGIYIAGELGGMGLIRNAVEQGRQAVDAIRKLDGIGKGNDLDLIIVGAGPAGFSASLAATQHKLRFITIEQDTLGGTVAHYPRGKIVMTAAMRLPLIGKVSLGEISKEALLDFWQDVERRSGVRIRYRERLETLTPNGRGFEVKTTAGTYRARAVLLAIGRRGTPRKLEVPGEELPKVVYRLVDPEQYRDRHVLVVGGGDSALEAAASIAEQPGSRVTLSYRSEAFARAKEKNRQRIEQAEQSGRLQVMFKSNVKNIDAQQVCLEQEGKLIELRNDDVIVAAGGILPTPFLKKIGIEVETKYGTA